MKKILFLSLCFIVSQIISIPPKLTVVVVVDQCAQRYLMRLQEHFQFGFDLLLKKGIVFTNAHVPHAKPATATGHASLNTGAYANMHGFVENKWIDLAGNVVACDYDPMDTGKLLTRASDNTKGCSPRNLMADGISDQFTLLTTDSNPYAAISISYKSRAAIATAGKMGKAIWFDQKNGMFTSSKWYYDSLPDWVSNFNISLALSNLQSIRWESAYPTNKAQYDLPFKKIYTQYTRFAKSIIGQTLPLDFSEDKQNRFYWLERSPEGNKVLIDLAKQCISTHVNKKENGNLLLWVCISALDKLGHAFGPDSQEVADMLYHLDKQLLELIEYANDQVGSENVLFVLSSDHGVSPNPKFMSDQKFESYSINQNDLKKELNEYLINTHNISGLITKVAMPNIYFNSDSWDALKKRKQKNIILALKRQLLKKNGIRSVWTYEQLETMSTQLHTQEDHYKKQLYPGRSGSLIVRTQPYTIISNYSKGAAHKTAYNYDTHIPLILYQERSLEKKRITDVVWSIQLPATLSEILQVPLPTAAEKEPLPKIFDLNDNLRTYKR